MAREGRTGLRSIGEGGRLEGLPGRFDRAAPPQIQAAASAGRTARGIRSDQRKMITTLNAMVRDDPRAKGIDPQTLRRDGDLALLSRVRAGDATLPFAVLIKECMTPCS